MLCKEKTKLAFCASKYQRKKKLGTIIWTFVKPQSIKEPLQEIELNGYLVRFCVGYFALEEWLTL